MLAGPSKTKWPRRFSTDEMLNPMDRGWIEGGFLQKGGVAIFVAGQPVGRPGTTNLVKLHRVGLG
jgi:pyruvate kinase